MAVRNPHARPRCSRRAPVSLPPVEERPESLAGVRFSLQRGDDVPGMAAITGSVWDMTYRCLYPDGVFDQIARFQYVIAASRAEAIEALRTLMFGFANRIVLYEARRLADRQPTTGNRKPSYDRPDE